ncbi:MAG TPA: hypothetical protein PKC39_15895 [Ferruginibacter sp.]|nr:hypothetical protein [Ferruginibacter sp.]HMP22442.1 hypothetical protein [Ferruginibacter sp.]
MKKIVIAAVFAFTTCTVLAQARLSTAEFQKVVQPAVEHELPYPEKTVKQAIENKMQQRGYKGKESKGYIVYTGVRMPEIGPDTYDLYFKINQKNKKSNTFVTMLVSTGYEKFIGEADNVEVMANSRRHLETMTEVVGAHDLELQIKSQEESVKKEEKKLAGLVDDGEDMKKKKAKLEKDMEDNAKKIEEQQKEAEKQRQILETLKSQRKG